MSVLIKGMEMPTRCEDCPVCHYMERGTITICGCKATMKIRPIDCNSKPYWCPLIEVPPHGRLIDADAVQEDWYRLNFDRKITDGTLAYWNFQLSKAPTVIEADSHSERELQRDYEAAVEYAQHCERYEPTYDPETGSM